MRFLPFRISVSMCVIRYTDPADAEKFRSEVELRFRGNERIPVVRQLGAAAFT